MGHAKRQKMGDQRLCLYDSIVMNSLIKEEVRTRRGKDGKRAHRDHVSWDNTEVFYTCVKARLNKLEKWPAHQQRPA